jgi:hypothetical protein
MTTILSFSIARAENPACKLSLLNVSKVSGNAVEFDIYIYNPVKKSEVKYFLGQYFIEFNPEVLNGGTLAYSIVSSDLPQELRPVNPTVKDNILMLATNSIPAEGMTAAVSTEGNGTLIVRMRLETSAKEFASENFDFRIRSGNVVPATKVSILNGTTAEMLEFDSNLQTDITGTGELPSSVIPKEFALMQNFPNPFNPSTTINFDLPKSADVRLSVFDLTGREISLVINQKLEAGTHSVQWNASQLASGIYFYKIRAGEFSQTKKMLLVK